MERLTMKLLRLTLGDRIMGPHFIASLEKREELREMNKIVFRKHYICYKQLAICLFGLNVVEHTHTHTHPSLKKNLIIA